VQADVLIVTVTKIESQAVIEVFQKASGQVPKTTPIGDKIYRDLGLINGARVLMVRSEMGAGGLGAAQQTVANGIKALSPSAIIMVGIAFGIDDKKQSIGDILVSQKLMLYDSQRVGTDATGKPKIIARGDRTTASTWLIDRFRSADEEWDDKNAKVRFGLILSGEKLVDNMEFRQQVREFEPEAIGGEMEGAGLYSASQSAKVDWILAKGICDWADGSKGENRDERQRLAALNAASFVLHVLQHAPLRREGLRTIELPLPLTQGSTLSTGLQVVKRASRSMLPHQLYFFGREKELATIANALSPESRGWGTLIDGPGGIGKTALAIRAGHLASDDQFAIKIFLSAKKRELTPAGEQPLEDFMLPNYLDLLSELARELGEDEITRTPPNERANSVRRALADKDVLIIIDNVEVFEEAERVRLYQFLDRLPPKCKAIVTSRRRADIAAKVIRLDRLALKEALELTEELAKTNKYLSKASAQERQELYEITQGNPLLIKWVVGQLGRARSQCRTIADACDFLKSAPKENDPLEYIFGDLLDTFTSSEMAVLATLVHFTQPAKVEWVAALAELATPAAQTALEDLADRALLVGDEQSQIFFLPALAATFLRRTCSEAVASTADRLADSAYALALEHGAEKFDRFPMLESEWPQIAAALPILLQGDNNRVQKLCSVLRNFLEFSGRWDQWLPLSQQAEEKALGVSDFKMAGWRAYDVAHVYYLRGEAENMLSTTLRCEAHWQKAGAGTREKATVMVMRGHGYLQKSDYPAAITAYQECVALHRTLADESQDLSIDLNWLANAETGAKDYASAERDYREALRIARTVGYKEGVTYITGNLARLAYERGDWASAERLSREALTLAEEIARIQLIASDCLLLALSIAKQQRPKEGLSYAQRAVEIFAKLRSPGLKEAQAALKECESST
jgi:nucleoside phosphorylase/tetratricopeptide (TPR) repeat protein